MESSSHILKQEDGTTEITNTCIFCFITQPNMKNYDSLINGFLQNVLRIDLKLYRIYPKYICLLCDRKLVSTLQFVQQIKYRFKLLEQYRIKKDIITDNFEEDLIKAYLKREGNVSEKKLENSELEAHLTSHVEDRSLDTLNLEINDAIVNKKLGIETPNYENDIEFISKKDSDTNSCNDIKEECHSPETTVSKLLEKPILTCSYCQKSYKNASNFKLHLKSHTGDLPYKCQYCDKKFGLKTDLRNHERTHTKERPFVCSLCEKTFTSSSALRTHVIQHTGKQEQCDLCDKKFCRKVELVLHLQKHKGVKPYLCTICGKTFAQKSHLTDHLTAHTDDRPYKCDQCDKTFKKRVILSQHQKLHKGLKSFKCPTCSYACYKKYRLEQHMKIHNSESGTTANAVKKRVFNCPVCDHESTSVKLLNQHMSSMHNVII